MIKNSELEKKVLAGIVQHQDQWATIAHLLSEDDFYSKDSKVHLSIFKILRGALNSAEVIDDTILIGRIQSLGTSFPDGIDVPEYIRALTYHKVSLPVFLQSVKELKLITFRRNVFDSARDIQGLVKNVAPDKKYSDLVSDIDKIHNDTIQNFEAGETKTVNLSERAEGLIEDIGNNPPKEVGIMSPYPSINKIYGSIFRGGNITCIAARAKCGKTTLMLDAVAKASYENDIPIIHFDNGEMSEEELIFRIVSGASGIPQYMLEDGSWRRRSYGDLSPEEVVAKVRAVWKWIKKTTILYENVAGLTSEEQCALLKRIYYSEVGRGNKAIFSYDYLKLDFNNLGKGSEWAFVGKTLHDFKQVISKELKFDGKPVVSMITSVQLNRMGITTNRTAESVQETESEAAIGLSDTIIQFVSHLFLLRRKTPDERGQWPNFGSHNLICLAARHLGEDMWAHLNPIEVPNAPARQNWINLDFVNFSVEDKGDLRDIVAWLENRDVEVARNEGGSGLPDSLS